MAKAPHSVTLLLVASILACMLGAPITAAAQATPQQTVSTDLTALQNAATAAQQAATATVTGPHVTPTTAQLSAMQNAVQQLSNSPNPPPVGEINALNTAINNAGQGEYDQAQVDALNAFAAAGTAYQQAIAATNPAAAAVDSTTNALTSAASSAVSATNGFFSSCPINLGACFIDLVNYGLRALVLFFLFLAAVLLGVTGLIFNWTVYATIFRFGNLVGNNQGMLAAWGVLRDIGNIVLLFGFILMGVSTILDLPNSNFTAKRALPGLIIFAILLNFSLFAAEAIIDTTNALGSSFFNQAGNGVCPTGQANPIVCATSYGIAGEIIQVSGLSSVFSVGSFNADPNPAASGQQLNSPPGLPPGLAGNIAGVGLTLFFLITSFVFIVAFILLIVRAVVLAFLMTVSPIGFAGMAVPPLQGIAKMWWDQLLKQSFFAPLMILFLLITIKFMQGVAIALATGSTSGAPSNLAPNLAAAFTTSGASNMSIVIVFLLMMGFMLASVQIARSMGAVGAGFATRTAGAFTFGTVAYVNRRTVGRASMNASRAIRSSSLGSTEIGRLLLRGTDYGAKSSFDMRASAPLQGVSKGMKIDMGESSKVAKSGYQGTVEHAAEERKKHAESLTLNPKQRTELLEHRVEARRLQEELYNNQAESNHLIEEENGINERINIARTQGNAALTAQLTADLAALQNDPVRQQKVAQLKIDRARLEGERNGHLVAAGKLNQELFKRRAQYAEGLENNPLSNTVGWVTGGRHFNTEGAHEIHEWLAETPQQRLTRLIQAGQGGGQQQNQPQQAQAQGAAAQGAVAGGGAAPAGGPAPAGGGVHNT